MLKYHAAYQCYFEHTHKAVGANAQNQGLVRLKRSRSHFHFSRPDMLYFFDKKTIIQELYFIAETLPEKSE